LLKGLRNIVTKEVKELVRDPRILLGIIIAPLLIFPLMGFMIRTSQEAAVESIRNISVGVIDLDQGVFAQNLTDTLRLYGNFRVEELAASGIDEVAGEVQNSNLTAVIVMPSGFSQNLTNGERAELKVYGVFRGGGVAESGAFAAVNSVLQLFEETLTKQRLLDASLDPAAVLEPIDVSARSIVRGEPTNINPDTLFALAMSQFFGFPFSIMLLIILAMQLASTSVASEKEEKTLETLLSLPISRFTILVGKLMGSVIVAAVGAVATIVGVVYYVGSFSFGTTAQIPVDLTQIGLSPGLLGYALLGVSLFVSLLSALALAVVVSVFAEDVRGAQSLLGFLYLPLFLPMLALLFTDINALPLAVRIVLLAIPFTHPMLAARAMLTGEYFTAIWGIAYVSIFTLAVLYAAARIFATEKILTAKISLGKKRPRED